MHDATEELIGNPTVARLLADTGVRVHKVETVPYMPSDIIWEHERSSDSWGISLYPPLYYDGPVTEMVALAITDIRHRTDPVYSETPGEEFNRLSLEYLSRIAAPKDSRELIKRELVHIDESVGMAFMLDFLLRNGYLSVKRARRLAGYQFSRVATTEGLVAVLGACAALRKAGGRGKEINDILIGNRWYELLAIIDEIEALLERGVAHHRDIVILYEAITRADDRDLDLASRVDFLRSLSLHSAQRAKTAYDLAISFAEPDRPIAERLATALQDRGYRIFYDDFLRAELWGKDLHAHLVKVHREQARYCLLLISAHFGASNWKLHELASALSRALDESREYVLPLRLDDTDLPGLLPTTGSVDLRTTPIDAVINLVADKLQA